MTTTNKGIVKFYNQPKGYGFIVDEEGKDIFFHITAVTEEVKKDDLVTYNIKDTKKGISAFDVKKR
jgi:CspA family cold shock protein